MKYNYKKLLWVILLTAAFNTQLAAHTPQSTEVQCSIVFDNDLPSIHSIDEFADIIVDVATGKRSIILAERIINNVKDESLKGKLKAFLKSLKAVTRKERISKINFLARVHLGPEGSRNLNDKLASMRKWTNTFSNIEERLHEIIESSNL